MRYKSLITLFLLSCISTLLAEKAILSPNIHSVISREPILTHPSIIQVQSDRQIITPANPWETTSLQNEILEPGGSGPRFESLLDYTNYPNGPYGGFIFEAGDTAMVWFRPGAECTLNSLDIRFNADGELSGETVMVQIYSIKDIWVDSLGGNGTYDFSLLNYVAGDNGPHDQLLTEIPVTIDEVGINTIYEIDLREWGGVIDLGCNDFAVLIGLPPGNGDGADFYYSQVLDDRGQHHGFKYYHDAAGWKSRLNFMFQATVDYWGGLPPLFTNETDHPDVYYSDNPGPYIIEADLPPYGSFSCNMDDSITQVHLKYSVNNGPEQFIDASEQIISGETITNHFQVELTEFSVGDVIEYEWWAADSSGDPSHEIRSIWSHTFVIREAGQFAKILLVDDNNTQIAANYWVPLLYEGQFDYWDVASGGILSAGILDNYHTLLWVQGNTSRGILAKENVDTDLITPFLDGGGSFMLSSTNYIESVENSLSDTWAPTLHPFLRDYLHVSSYATFQNIDLINGVSADTLYRGVRESEISGMYASEPFIVQPALLGFSSWPDAVRPDAEADTTFKVYTNNLDETWVGAGVTYSGNYKTIFLPWQFEAIVDDHIRFDLMTNILTFLSPPCYTVPPYYEGGNRYAQASNAGDILVYGSVPDFVEIESMSVDFTIDKGNTWSSTPMIDGVANIPALSIGDTCVFLVTATDTCGLTSYSKSYDVWKLNFTPTADILYVGDDSYTWYYGDNYDSTNFVRTRNIVEAAGLTIDYYDLDSLYLMDAYSILNQYSGVIWNAYADWDGASMPMQSDDNPLSQFDGTILYSSEEMLGTWFDWQNAAFGPGDFIYDVMGVEWYGADYAPDSIMANSQTDLGTNIPGFNLDTARFYFGNMADIVDPIDSPGPYTVDPPFSGWLPDYSQFYPVSSSTPSSTFLSFSMMMMPDAIYETFINNWLNIVAVESTSPMPTQLGLAQNYPNPFNPVTTIQFDVPKNEHITLTIYNLLGQKVIELINEDYAPGSYDIQWNGLDYQARPVSSGLYIYRLTAGDHQLHRKMVFLK